MASNKDTQARPHAPYGRQLDKSASVNTQSSCSGDPNCASSVLPIHVLINICTTEIVVNLEECLLMRCLQTWMLFTSVKVSSNRFRSKHDRTREYTRLMLSGEKTWRNWSSIGDISKKMVGLTCTANARHWINSRDCSAAAAFASTDIRKTWFMKSTTQLVK